MAAPGQINLLGLPRKKLEAFFAGHGEPGYRAQQVMRWIYHRGHRDFAAMTDLSLALRKTLQQHASVEVLQVVAEHVSVDGTCKWLFGLPEGNQVETVFIPEPGRGTLCISSQVGCVLDCSFCATARQGFNRNLSSAEIVAQVWSAHRQLDSIRAGKDRSITNVVFMGMGEPLANLDAVAAAAQVLVDDLAYGLSKRRVTVSTAGIVPGIDKLAASVDISLAVSLHAPNDSLRDQLVPINRRYPLADLLAACHRYLQGDRKKHVTFEYVMLAGVNDQLHHATELCDLLRDMRCKVNLIPFNSFHGTGYRRSSREHIERFGRTLQERGILTTIRRPRGEDIAAACGQLAGQVDDRSRRARRFTTPRFGES